MRNWLRPTLILLRNIMISLITYSIIIGLGTFFLSNLQKSPSEILQTMNSPAFYTGLVVTIILVILQKAPSKQLQHKISRYTLLAVSYIILSSGFLFMMLSYNKELWNNQNLSYNLNAFGVGVTMLALGFAFLFAFSPIMTRQSDSAQRNIENKLDRNINKLSKETDRIEKIVADCKNLTEELRRLKEEENQKANKS